MCECVVCTHVRVYYIYLCTCGCSSVSALARDVISGSFQLLCVNFLRPCGFGCGGDVHREEEKIQCQLRELGLEVKGSETPAGYLSPWREGVGGG